MKEKNMGKQVILYVDDEPEALRAVRMGLEARGYSVLSAKNGKEALDIVRSHVPDLIITDLRMQPMNGFELFLEIKKKKQFKDTPFFFLTAVDEPLAQKYGQKLGVDAYITKPVDFEELIMAIKNRLAGQ
jgi:CheY-like chemotaxis protein